MTDSGLIDPWTLKPIPSEEIALLGQEIAYVDAAAARPAFSGHVAFGIDPQRLIQIIVAADSGSSLDWWRLAEEMEEIFPHYAAVLNKRKAQIMSLPITVEPADQADADAVADAQLVRDWLQAGVLQNSMFDLLDGIGKGFSVMELIWDQQPPARGKPGHCWPSRMVWDAQRFFEFSYIDGKTPWLRTQSGFDTLPPHKFMVHLHPAKSGNISRSSIARQVAFLMCYAVFNQKDWALFANTYGLPLRLGKYGPSASPNDKSVLRQAVFSIARDVAAIIPDSMQIELQQAADKGSGHALFPTRGNWLNYETSKLVLGSTASTDAISGGHAVGKEHREVEGDIEKADAARVAFTLNTSVVPMIVSFSRGPRPAYPRISIGRPQETPLNELIDAVADWGPLGMRFSAQELYNRLQMKKPEDGEDVIGGVEPQAEPKPDIPEPVVKAPMPSASMMQVLLPGLARMAQETPPDVVGELTDRLATEAAGALHGLTDQVKAAFHAARDMRDLAKRLRALKLEPDAYALAMERGMAVAHLFGQAEILKTIGELS